MEPKKNLLKKGEVRERHINTFRILNVNKCNFQKGLGIEEWWSGKCFCKNTRMTVVAMKQQGVNIFKLKQ